MYDVVHVPEEVAGVDRPGDYQTVDLDRALDTYEVDAGGRLIRTRATPRPDSRQTPELGDVHFDGRLLVCGPIGGPAGVDGDLLELVFTEGRLTGVDVKATH